MGSEMCIRDSYYNLDFFKTSELICNDDEGTCEYITPDKQKLLFDNFHYTVEGAKYIGRKIFNLGWLNKKNLINSK